MKEKVIGFLKLIRWFHELVAILPFVALFLTLRYFTSEAEVTCNLSGFHFFVLCICVQLLIAAGCVLNDIMDRHIDKINKPKTHIIGRIISLKSAKWIFGMFTVLIAFLSVYISLYVFWEWSLISIAVYGLSISYDLHFKRSPLMGNILIAALAAFIPLVIFFFAKDCIGELKSERINLLIWLYALFPFLIIIPRELSLDISDLEGDKADGCRTLPIVIGEQKARYVVVSFILLIVVLSGLLVLIAPYYTLVSIVVDTLLFYYLYLLRSCKTRIDYIRAGRFLWFIMILGLIGLMLSCLFS
ncbi:MAG: geranylgeranylglycerol-phosphate geranylgeranyltransferase [Bacteroidia bacterium]|nr:geranylgeranylglycerol-phosphate geranylgeranyltransferase [Bacteroidia bacterium]